MVVNVDRTQADEAHTEGGHHDIDTWVSLAALLTMLLTLGGLILTQGRWLRSELAGDIARLDVKVDGLRAELKGDIGRLDDRVYALAACLRPQVEEAQSGSRTGPQAG